MLASAGMKAREERRFAWAGRELPEAWREWLRAHGTGQPPARIELDLRALDTVDGELAAAGLVAWRGEWAAVPTIEIEAVPIHPEVATGPGPSVTIAGDEAAALRELSAGALALRLAGAPRTIFALHVARERWGVARDEVEAEVRIDRVDVRAADGANAGVLGELVLEHVRGSSASFAALGDSLGELPEARVPEASVVDRARSMVGLPAIEWPGKPADLDPDAPLGEAALALFAELWATAIAHEPGVRAGLDPEHVHKMRVAMRRLRTALRVFESALEGAPLRRWRNEMRWLGRLLGEVRDLDVHRLALSSWRTRFPEAPEDGWPELDRLLVGRRLHARAALLEALDGPRRRALDELADASRRARPRSSTTVGGAARRLVGEQVERCRSALDELRVHGTVELAHRVRIRVKNLRYTLEFLREVVPERFGEDARVLEQAQEELGVLQDAVSTGRLARELARVQPPTSIARHALGALVGFGAASESAALSIATSTVESIDLAKRLRALED